MNYYARIGNYIAMQGISLSGIKIAFSKKYK
jgi:hypothetical protein